MSKLLTTTLCLVLLACATSCYRMPSEGDYSLIPATNNPDYTRESSGKSKNSMPGVGY